MSTAFQAYELNLQFPKFHAYDKDGNKTASGEYATESPAFIYPGKEDHLGYRKYLTVFRAIDGSAIAFVTDTRPFVPALGVAEVVSTEMDLSEAAISAIISYHEAVTTANIFS